MSIFGKLRANLNRIKRAIDRILDTLILVK